MAHTLQHSIEADITGLLKTLIAVPSFSREEDKTAGIIERFLQERGVTTNRSMCNVWAANKFFNPAKPSILLNSHHDTVKPNSGYTRNPFEPAEENGKLFGLGSNDAGGALVALLGTFLHFYHHKDLPFNLIYAATAEEEISGTNGIENIIKKLPPVEFAIVGEPTQMNMAVAERGLMVLDCTAIGKAGHAARNEGENAVYLALKDIEWFKNYRFEKTSEWLGAVSMQVTVINAGTAHNQVPAECRFVVDVRLNECYTHQQLLTEIRNHVTCMVNERSTRIKPSFIEGSHPILQAAKSLGIELYGSPTTSDMALMPWKAVKIGPGDSARSHSADEFIYTDEIIQGLKKYIELIETYSSKILKS